MDEDIRNRQEYNRDPNSELVFKPMEKISCSPTDCILPVFGDDPSAEKYSDNGSDSDSDSNDDDDDENKDEDEDDDEDSESKDMVGDIAERLNIAAAWN